MRTCNFLFNLHAYKNKLRLKIIPIYKIRIISEKRYIKHNIIKVNRYGVQYLVWWTSIQSDHQICDLIVFSSSTQRA